MEHYELVQEMGAVERMTTQERLKHARKRRTQQLKKFSQYERQLDKESTKKKKNQDKQPPQRRVRKNNRGNVKFAPNIALLEAAARNDLNEVKILLESGVNPDVTNEDGLTALHQCCIDDSEEMMKLLLDYNANVNACDSEMWTPLHAAATCGHMMLCKYLIDRGAELLAVNADGNMPYDICEDEVTLDHIETEMAKRGITQEQIDITRLATEHRMLADVKEFASTGGDLEVVDHMGATLLHISSANGYIEVAEFLLDNHVSVDKRDNESWQPIHAAAYWAQQEILEMLVENGADLDSKTKNGETPFDLCEEPDLKQKILDMKDEIETKRFIRQQRLGSQRKQQQRISSRNASMRRSSMRGDKTQLFKKEHKEEALHFGVNLMHDDELLMEAEEEHDAVPSTDLDEVTVMVTGEDDHQPPPSPPASRHSHDMHDSTRQPPDMHDSTRQLTAWSTASQPAAVTTITIGAEPQNPPSASPPASRSQTRQSADSQRPSAQPSSPPRSRPSPSDSDFKPVAAVQNAVRETSLMRENTSRENVQTPVSQNAVKEAGPTPKAVTQNASRENVPTAKVMTQNASRDTGPPPKAATQNTSRDSGPKPRPVSQNASAPRQAQNASASRQAQNAPAPRQAHVPQVLPRQPVYPAPPSERRQSGSTLSDLKKQRSNSRENLLDMAVQNMFLESVQSGRHPQGGGGGVQGNPAYGREKAKNGHHHHNNNAMHYSAADGQLRRFVAPTSAPVVGGDEEKQKCCVIL